MSLISLSMLAFINYFTIPIIGLRIYNIRHSIDWNVSFENFYRYALICVLNLPFTRVFVVVVEKITSLVVTAESVKYTVLAVFSVIMLAYIMEWFEKNVKVNVEIKDKTCTKESQNEEA